MKIISANGAPMPKRSSSDGVAWKTEWTIGKPFSFHAQEYREISDDVVVHLVAIAVVAYPMIPWDGNRPLAGQWWCQRTPRSALRRGTAQRPALTAAFVRPLVSFRPRDGNRPTNGKVSSIIRLLAKKRRTLFVESKIVGNAKRRDDLKREQDNCTIGSKGI